MKRIGVITSGGDAPGTNACVRAIALRGFDAGLEVHGIFESWGGLMAGNVRPLTRQDISGIGQRAGTVLRSGRGSLLTKPGDDAAVMAALEAAGIEGLVAIGGNGSQSGAHVLAQAGFPVVGVPKTIDNDLVGTDFSVGFFTAAEVATHALDNLRATAEAHSRVMIVESMGRDSGWIAVEAGIAGGADLVLIPEHEFTLEAICEKLRVRHDVHKRNYSIVIIAEGAMDKDKKLDPRRGTKDINARPRLGGVGTMLALEIERRLGYNSRCTTLGYLQRCAAPIALDRVLATRLSDFAFDLLADGKSGVMAALAGRELEAVPLAQIARKTKRVTDDYFRLAELFG